MIPSRRAALVLVAALALTAACSNAAHSPAGSTSRGAARPAAGGRSAGSCGSDVTRDALPAWARTGFHGDGSGVPHVFGEHGDIVAVLFDYPPVASSDSNAGNKILWVSRLPQQPMQPLTIKAALDGTTTSVSREIAGGPGPSGVDLPKAGCWRLALSWSGHTDTMRLTFH
jgi:hypothetical protein